MQEQQKRTSLKLSKKLKSVGFIGGGLKNNNWCWCRDEEGEFLGRLNDAGHLPSRNMNEPFFICTSFDILNDLCVTHANELFGDKKSYNGKSHTEGVDEWRNSGYWEYEYEFHSHMIYTYLKENKKEEAEKYFIENSILFK
jgi:hypothetical protein